MYRANSPMGVFMLTPFALLVISRIRCLKRFSAFGDRTREICRIRCASCINHRRGCSAFEDPRPREEPARLATPAGPNDRVNSIPRHCHVGLAIGLTAKRSVKNCQLGLNISLPGPTPY